MIGQMRERLTVQRQDAQTFGITSLTRVGTVATAVVDQAHGYITGDFVTVAGAIETAYNVKAKVTVLSTTSFTYTVAGSPTTPATGAPTVSYTSDAQGGHKFAWRTLVSSVPAELLPLRGSERLQVAAINSDLSVRFRIRSRVDLTPKQRVLWTPSWPPGGSQQTYEIAAIVPMDHGRVYSLLECQETSTL